MKEIQLTQGKTALVSDDKFEFLNQWKWRLQEDKKRGLFYAVREVWKGRQAVLMHRLITNAPNGMQVDHKDGNGLNNQDENLRICTPSQNSANKKAPKTNKSGYKGVCWAKREKTWRAILKKDGRTVLDKFYKNVEDAARAYDEASIIHFGEFARLNFPNSKQE